MTSKASMFLVNRAPGRGTPPVVPTRDPMKRPRRFNFRAKAITFKQQRLVQCESLLEATASRLLELLTQIESYSEQPTPLTLKRAGRRASKYTPDFLIQWRTGAQWLVEVKPKQCVLTPEWKCKLAAAGVAAVVRGQHLVVLTEIDIEAADLPAIQRVLEARHKRYIRSLGSPGGAVEQPTEPLEGLVETRILRILARAFRASPSVRVCKAFGVTYSFPCE